MDFDKLLEPLVNYLNILIDFLSFDVDFMTQYRRINDISPEALSIFFVGMVFAVVILKSNNVQIFDTGIDQAPDRSLKNPDKVGAASLLIFVPLMFITVILFELSLLINSIWSDTDFGTIRDTINAAMITVGLLSPFQAIASRINSYVRTVSVLKGAAKIACGLLQMVAGLFQLTVSLYSFRIFAAAHGVNWTSIVIPVILVFALFILFACPLGLFIIWRREAIALTMRPLEPEQNVGGNSAISDELTDRSSSI